MSRFSNLAIASALLGGAALMPATANAALIDLTTGGWSFSSGNTVATRAFSIGTVTLTALNGGMLNNSESGSGVNPPCGDNPLACTTDGFGVSDDEITQPATTEQIRVTLPVPIGILGFHFLDLFNGPNGTDPITELATWVTDPFQAGSANGVQINNGANPGYLFANFVSDGLVSSITFQAPNCGLFGTTCTGAATNDFALAGIEVVPLPGAVLLFGTALAGLGWMRRRRSAGPVESVPA